jgi:prophage regulatory protein
MATPMPANERLLSFHQVSHRVGLKRTAIYAAVAAGHFPRPIKLGRASRWLESELDAWIAVVAASRRAT